MINIIGNWLLIGNIFSDTQSLVEKSRSRPPFGLPLLLGVAHNSRAAYPFNCIISNEHVSYNINISNFVRYLMKEASLFMMT